MKIGMVFPGYGSQYVGMGKDLYDNSRLIQEYFEEASNCLNVNFVKLCFASSDVELSKIPQAYPSLFLVSSSISAYLKELGVEPSIVGGCNFGEYAALCAAKSLSLPDGLYFLSKYAHYYQELLNENKATFKSIEVKKFSRKKLKELCTLSSSDQELVSIVAYYSDKVHVVSGTKNALNAVQKEVLDQGGLVDDVAIEAGLHSRFMLPVVKKLSMYIEKIDFKDAKIPFISGVDGATIEQGATIKSHIMNQIQVPVRLEKVLSAIHDVDIILEIGPGKTLSESIKHCYPNKKLFSINKQSDIEELLNFISQLKKEAD